MWHTKENIASGWPPTAWSQSSWHFQEKTGENNQDKKNKKTAQMATTWIHQRCPNGRAPAGSMAGLGLAGSITVRGPAGSMTAPGRLVGSVTVAGPTLTPGL
mmetsp:Transcript_103165/g.169831  ORF Transcript_103165/g.169831 Transcript_103165/m.169831 type:complete len:102 (+) Transcript_103165:53-358(+)